MVLESLSVTGYDGNVTLTDIGGTVLINTVNGNILATFNSVAADKPMAFSNVNGDIDISYPANTNFPLK